MEQTRRRILNRPFRLDDEEAILADATRLVNGFGAIDHAGEPAAILRFVAMAPASSTLNAGSAARRVRAFPSENAP